ncbi:unnamed protein product [Pylaiella littoralis]
MSQTGRSLQRRQSSDTFIRLLSGRGFTQDRYKAGKVKPKSTVLNTTHYKKEVASTHPPDNIPINTGTLSTPPQTLTRRDVDAANARSRLRNFALKNPLDIYSRVMTILAKYPVVNGPLSTVLPPPPPKLKHIYHLYHTFIMPVQVFFKAQQPCPARKHDRPLLHSCDQRGREPLLPRATQRRDRPCTFYWCGRTRTTISHMTPMNYPRSCGGSTELHYKRKKRKAKKRGGASKHASYQGASEAKQNTEKQATTSL